jgi:N-acetylmuramoyl-L-alanine amidase
VVVLDPAHGGADPGARGSSGAVEKDVVLMLARAARLELEREGLRVVMTRDGDQNPSFDERSAIANAPRGVVFLSFHVSTTGQAGTARAYSFDPGAVETAVGAPAAGESPRGAIGLRGWDEAQRPSADLSRRLADLLQVQLAQRFSNSPEISASVAVRGLRSVAAPAVAIEVSSVSVEDPKSLEAMASPLAAAVAHAVMAFRPVYEAAKE